MSQGDFTSPTGSILTKLLFTAGGMGLAYKYHGGPTWKATTAFALLLASITAASGYELLLIGSESAAGQMNEMKELDFQRKLRMFEKK